MSSLCVGNDIVDLTNPRTEGRAADERFVARVFAAEERRTVERSKEPDLELWCHWAAKEAGFKALSKLVGAPPPFVHRSFRVTWRDAELPPADPALEPIDLVDTQGAAVIRRGTVTWGDHHAPVAVARHAEGVHAVAFARRAPGGESPRLRPAVALLDEPDSPWAARSVEELLPRFTEREADAVYSLSSAAVRVGARRELARLLEVAERRLQIVCAPGPTSQRPPLVLLDGAETEADVSLSHDGPLIAWVLWVGGPVEPDTSDREDNA